MTFNRRSHGPNLRRNGGQDGQRFARQAPGEESGDPGYHRWPRFQLSIRAWIATAMQMKTQRRVSRWGTSGRIADWDSASTSWATSVPAAPTVAMPAAFQGAAVGEYLSGRGGTKRVARAGKASPQLRPGPR